MYFLLASPGGLGLGAILWLILMAVYFIPTFVAFGTKHPHRAPVLVLNIFLGWTVVGWVGALIWAMIKPSPETAKY